MKRLKERKKKADIKWKIANIIVKKACEKQGAIILESLGKKVAK